MDTREMWKMAALEAAQERNREPRTEKEMDAFYERAQDVTVGAFELGAHWIRSLALAQFVEAIWFEIRWRKGWVDYSEFDICPG